jgi:hypothetical protein
MEMTTRLKKFAVLAKLWNEEEAKATYEDPSYDEEKADILDAILNDLFVEMNMEERTFANSPEFDSFV